MHRRSARPMPRRSSRRCLDARPARCLDARPAPCSDILPIVACRLKSHLISAWRGGPMEKTLFFDTMSVVWKWGRRPKLRNELFFEGMRVVWDWSQQSVKEWNWALWCITLSEMDP